MKEVKRLLVELSVDGKEFEVTWTDRRLMKLLLENNDGVAIKSNPFGPSTIWWALSHGWANCIEGILKPNRLTIALARQFDDYISAQRRHYRDIRKVVTSKTRVLKIINEGDVQVERSIKLRSTFKIRFVLDPHSIVFLYQESKGLIRSREIFFRVCGTPYYYGESGLPFAYEDKLCKKARIHVVKKAWEKEIEEAVLNRKEVKKALTMNLI